VLYSYLGLRQAFSSPYVVQDDVRQHVFWMWRFVDPELLPHDLIADYFQSVAPAGYTALYKLMALLGVHPLIFSKIVPVGLEIGVTVFCFYLCLEICPVPIVAFASTILLNQSLWMDGDLPSGTPRAFIYPLLLAFLYFLLRRSTPICTVIILLQGLFYQPLVLISMALLGVRVLRWHKGRVRFSTDRKDYQLFAIGSLAGVIILSPQLLFPSPYGPTITGAEARSLPEFLPGGRSEFFEDNFWLYWLGGDSGFLSRGLTEPATLLASFLLPILFRYPRHFPLLQQTTHNRKLLSQLLLASIGLFFLAHALLFKLYAPNRYTIHTFRIVMALSAAIVFITLLDATWHWVKTWRGRHGFGAIIGAIISGGTLAIVATGVMLYPCFMDSFLDAGYFGFDRGAKLYQFLQQQPKDITIASIAREADNIATFAARSVLVSREHARPYDTGFYRQFRQRATDVIRAQYSSDLGVVQAVIEQYGIDFWLLDSRSFDPDWIIKSHWLLQFQPEISAAMENIARGRSFVLLQRQADCTVFTTEDLVLLDSQCLYE
jgi:hypothetical protein